jgi:hypothetical protein
MAGPAFLITIETVFRLQLRKDFQPDSLTRLAPFPGSLVAIIRLTRFPHRFSMFDWSGLCHKLGDWSIEVHAQAGK